MVDFSSIIFCGLLRRIGALQIMFTRYSSTTAIPVNLALYRNLETNNKQEVLVRAHSIIIQCEEFMRQFEDGLWIAKALKRDKHRETFTELHESLTYLFQVHRESECFAAGGFS